MKKRCSKCHRRKLLKYFSKRNDRPCGVASACKICFRKAYATSLRGKRYAKKSGLKIYGLSPEQFKARMNKQKNRCVICRRKLKRPEVDHDHRTGQVRELLCSFCNKLLGFSREDIGTLKRAIKYLIKHRRNK